MGTPKVSSRANKTFGQFEAYLRTTGLKEDILEIIKKHAVSLGDIYYQDKVNFPTCRAARLEVWWWLHTTKYKSQSEIAEIFGITSVTIHRSFKKLRQIATDMQLELNASTGHEVAKTYAQLAHDKTSRNLGDATRFRKD